MTYLRADPSDPPMVQVLVDGAWWPGHVIAQEQREDGGWDVHVHYSRAPGKRRSGTFDKADVRPDETDYSARQDELGRD